MYMFLLFDTTVRLWVTVVAPAVGGGTRILSDREVFFSRRVSIVEKNEFQNCIFLFSNFLGATTSNNCNVSWLLYCSDAKSFCLITKGQPFHVTVIQDGGAQEI